MRLLLAGALAVLPCAAQRITLDAPSPCHAEFAVGPLDDAMARSIEGDVRWRMPGIDMEAHVTCEDAASIARVGLIQVLVEYAVAAHYGMGRVEARVRALPVLDALEREAPWYPAVRRREGTKAVWLSARDAPGGFSEERQAFVGTGLLSQVTGTARFVTFVAYRTDAGDYLPLRAVTWATTLAVRRAPNGALFSATNPIASREATRDEMKLLAATVRVKAPVANRQIEWWWVPATQSEPERRVAAIR